MGLVKSVKTKIDLIYRGTRSWKLILYTPKKNILNILEKN